MTRPAYPLPSRSEEDHWPMSHGLVEDVAEALSRHGYPPIPVSPSGAADFVRLRQHVWHFITDRECDVLDPPAAEPGETDRADDERDELVAQAMHCVDTSSAKHWPTVAGVLAGEVERLRAVQCNALCSDIEHERDQLRQQRRAALALTNWAEYGALRWEDPLPVPEWVAQVRAALGAADEPTTGGES